MNDGLGLGFGQKSIESFFVVLLRGARFDFDDFGGVEVAVEAVAHPVDVAKTPTVDYAQILELRYVPLDGAYIT